MKIYDNFENEQNQFFRQLKINEKMDRSRTMNKRDEKVGRGHLYYRANLKSDLKDLIFLEI